MVILPACFKLLSRPLCTIKFASAQQRLLFQFLFILSVISFSGYSCFAVLCTEFLWNITTQQAIWFKGLFKNDVTQNGLLLIIHPLCHAPTPYALYTCVTKRWPPPLWLTSIMKALLGTRTPNFELCSWLSKYFILI